MTQIWLVGSKIVGQPWWKDRILTTSKLYYSSQIIRSPPLVSLDHPEIWSSDPKHAEFPSSHIFPHGQTARIIDGKTIAEEIRLSIANEVRQMKDSIGNVPGLGVILVGKRRDSCIYVRNKIIACEEVGIKFLLRELPDNCSEDDICYQLKSFNENPGIHGILVQLPLPQHLDNERILDVLSLQKDVDGFHPLNIGNLAMCGREPLFIPCTPKGCVELLLRSDVEIMGKKAVVIGRSNIVGLPTALLLQRHHATVSLVHPFTKNPERLTREADILVAAAGVPNLVRGSWLKPGAVVIDIGTNPIEDLSCEHGYHLTGDVCFKEAVQVASVITPVPGGVGPMTVAMLLCNTLESAKRAFNLI